MSDIRRLENSEFADAASISANAYPGFTTDAPDDVQQLTERLQSLNKDPLATIYGLFRSGELVGMMILYDFEMIFRSTLLMVGGIGQVAVHLAHKKEHVAKEMVQFYIQHYRERACTLLALYPFRPDFYKQMGFGYGSKMNRYRVAPANLPKGPSKASVRYLTEKDKEAIVACNHRYMARTHGMMAKTEREAQNLFRSEGLRLVGYEQDGSIQGYLSFVFQRTESFTTNDILVKEFICENPRALSQLLTFLRSQADQIRTVVIETQDDSFHYLLRDPRSEPVHMFDSVHQETNQQGVGLMYRITNVPGLFEQLAGPQFGERLPACIVRFVVQDSFLPANAGNYLVRFEGGNAAVLARGEADVEVRLDVAELSSLLMGTVDFSSLYRYNLAQVSNLSYLDTLAALFSVQKQPVCVTRF